VEVLVSAAARNYVQARGGTVFVRTHTHRCCAGPLTMLDTTMTAPSDADQFESFKIDGVDVKFRGSAAGAPHQLTVDIRGIIKRHPVAFWDGCAFKP
jgi:hypothetical protein